MIFGSLTIALIYRLTRLILVNGVAQAFNNFLMAYHMQSLLPIFVIMIILGSVGSMVSWVIFACKRFAPIWPRWFLTCLGQ